MSDTGARYERLAQILLTSDDPVHAIASVVGDHEARLDIAMERIVHLEAVLNARGRA